MSGSGSVVDRGPTTAYMCAGLHVYGLMSADYFLEVIQSREGQAADLVGAWGKTRQSRASSLTGTTTTLKYVLA